MTACARDADDTRARRVDEQGKQVSGESKVSEMVHRELHLESIPCLSFWYSHYAGVVDQKIELLGR